MIEIDRHIRLLLILTTIFVLFGFLAVGYKFFNPSTPQFTATTAINQLPDFEIDGSIDYGSIWPIGEFVDINIDGTYQITNGSQVITMTGPITLTRIGE